LIRSRSCRLLLVLGITLLAAFFRLYKIDSLPPSDGYDQANYGLDVLGILQGERPIFLESNFGREVLFSYLITLVYFSVRDIALAVYLTSAIVGVLTIPAVYLAAEEMFRAEKGALARYGSLLAALAMAVSYWHLSWSRNGLRAILVPFFAATTAYLLWKGLRTGSRWAFVGCGLSLGLSLHSYQAARALPPLVLLGFAYVFWSRRSVSRRDLANVGLVVAAALVLFAPLGYYFLTHPGSSSLRIEQTLILDTEEPRSDARIFLDQLVKTVLTFNVRGDIDARVNLEGQPALDPFFSLGFLLGIAISLVRLKQPLYLFLLTWLGGLTAPAVLAQYGAVTKRAIGATPAVAMLVAVGCLVTWDAVHGWLDRRYPGRSRSASLALAALIGVGFVYSGVRTYRGYFLIWGQDPNLFTHFETGQSAIGKYIKDRPPEEKILLSPVPADHHSVLLNSERRPGVKSYQGRFCMVVVDQAAHDTTYVIVPSDDKNSLGLLQAYLPQGRVTDQGPLHYQLPYFLAYFVPAGTPAQLPPFTPLEANWDDEIGLLGYALDSSTYGPGDTIHLTLYFRALGKVDKDYTVFTHLLGTLNPATGGPLWTQSDSEPCRRGYRTSVWDVDEVVIDHFELAIPAQAPPGEYELEMGFYDWRTLERLPVLDANGQPASDHIILEQLPITVPASSQS
jgi:4-amino-4-deoxy-L-arabinose transferase-like glycosyltransferase